LALVVGLNTQLQLQPIPDGEDPKPQVLTDSEITGIIMALSARREVLQPGSPIYDYILAGNPRLLKAASYLQNGLFYFLFIAHGIETPLFAWTRLRKHNVSVLSLTWLKWLLSVLVGE
jgi:hypothetical protein